MTDDDLTPFTTEVLEEAEHGTPDPDREKTEMDEQLNASEEDQLQQDIEGLR